MGSLRVGKVVAVHPEAHKVDLVMCDDGRRIPMVDVVSTGFVSTNSGVLDLHVPTVPDQPYSIKNTGNRDVLAYVAFAGEIPIVMGFRVPEIGQMTFKDPGRRIDRHGSDVYSTIDDAGNFEMAFPNGTYVRVGTSPAHEDLTGLDFDKQWKISRNKTASTHVMISHRPGGVEKFSLHIDPSGNVTLVAAGNLTSSAAMWAHTGPVSITGDVSVTGKIDASGEITGNGTHLHTHKHGGGTIGSGLSDPPA